MNLLDKICLNRTHEIQIIVLIHNNKIKLFILNVDFFFEISIRGILDTVVMYLKCGCCSELCSVVLFDAYFMFNI